MEKLYTAFVSKSNDPQDVRIIRDIIKQIQKWSFKIVTVENEPNPDEKIPPAVESADCVIVIATKRDLTVNGIWKAPEWLYSETGIGHKKPTLLIKDKDVNVGGLLGHHAQVKKIYYIEFDSLNLQELMPSLDFLIPSFRNWIRTKKKDEFLKTLAKISLAGVAAVVTGIIGYEIGKRKARKGRST